MAEQIKSIEIKLNSKHFVVIEGLQGDVKEFADRLHREIAEWLRSDQPLFFLNLPSGITAEFRRVDEDGSRTHSQESKEVRDGES